MRIGIPAARWAFRSVSCGELEPVHPRPLVRAVLNSASTASTLGERWRRPELCGACVLVRALRSAISDIYYPSPEFRRLVVSDANPVVFPVGQGCARRKR
jgi:hypothetical protein